MAARSSFGSPSFRLVAKGLLELHRLTMEGKDDSLEAEIVRDALDIPLRALNETERTRAQWLSEDLYSISDSRELTGIKEMNPQAREQLNEANEARGRGDWDRALALLRRWSDYLPEAGLSFIRGSIWREAGIRDVATEFFRHASVCDSSNIDYRDVHFHSLAESDPQAARKLAEVVLADPEKYSTIVVARAAEMAFNSARSGSRAESISLCHRLIGILERALARIETAPAEADLELARSLILGLLGWIQEYLGNTEAAVDYYSRGLVTNPANEALRVARGILQYGSSPRAITDFEHAVAEGHPLVWPYLFLAHDHILNNRFEDCRIICEIGLSKEGSGSAKSHLEEWRAIALAQLGASPEEVRGAFDTALALDSSNDFASLNRDAFEASLLASNAHHPNWAQRPPAALRQLGLADYSQLGLADYSLVA